MHSARSAKRVTEEDEAAASAAPAPVTLRGGHGRGSECWKRPSTKREQLPFLRTAGVRFRKPRSRPWRSFQVRPSDQVRSDGGCHTDRHLLFAFVLSLALSPPHSRAKQTRHGEPPHDPAPAPHTTHFVIFVSPSTERACSRSIYELCPTFRLQEAQVMM